MSLAEILNLSQPRLVAAVLVGSAAAVAELYLRKTRGRSQGDYRIDPASMTVKGELAHEWLASPARYLSFSPVQM